MKKIFSVTFILMMSTFFSCKKGYLDEKPLDFLSSANALVTNVDFNIAVNDMYRVTRIEFFSRDEQRPFDYIFGTDIVYDGQPDVARHTNMAAAYAPSGGPGIPLSHWSALYKIISEANTIIGRIPASSMTDVQKTQTEAKGRFFRAFAYRTLAYLYGGVPLTLTEVATPKTDFVRATKAAVLNQCIDDLKFAVINLPAITAVQDGEISNLAAGHLLAEVYLAAGQFQNAADAATVVINNPSVGLMKNRFGSKSTVTPGDVYWDLFQPGNQNRKAGNTEALWVIQFETDVLGGGSTSTGMAGSYLLERQHAPLVRDLSVNGKAPFLWPVDDYTGGRGIGWAVSTKYFSDAIWQSDFNNDIRNSNNNFVRNFISNNPASPLFGKVVSTQNPPAGVTVPSRSFYAYQSKCTTPGGHPTNLILDPVLHILKGTAGGTYLDQYMFRLAETYLIRAEAYLGLGDNVNAAADINVVRARSKASAVLPANVNIDYILDERMRELGVEEKRRLTLMRLGLLYDRVKRFNPYYSDVKPIYNLWPIPADEIERNNTAKLEQNPGY